MTIDQLLKRLQYLIKLHRDAGFLRPSIQQEINETLEELSNA